MNRKLTLNFAALTLVAGVLGAGAFILRPAVQAAPTAASPRTPVIVELFTSEGCSSCPPADAVLSRLEKSQPVAGAEVIALGEHVDYWNHGGWADKFSSPAYSARQSEYSTAFRKDSVYTPQMIVDGRTEFVGSDDDMARAAITRAARQPKASVSLTRGAGDTLTVRVDHLPPSAQSDPADVVLAVTEDGLRSSVGGGENAGRHLAHDAVVRRLTPLGRITGGTFTATPAVPFGPGGQHGSRRAVVFVQERVSRRIIGSAQVGL